MQKTITLLAALIASISAEYIKPSDIKRGCARFYLSNPLESFRGMSEDGTQFWQVCTPLQRDKPAKIAIGAGVFAKIKDKFGADTANSITFISTGADVWVDIFSGKSQTGETYAVTPLSDCDLKTIPLLNDPDHTSYNDNIISGYIRSTDGNGENPDSNDLPPGTVPIAVWYSYQNVKTVPSDNGCAYFYDSDPTAGNSNGFAVCMSDGQHLAHMNQKDMHERGFYDILKDHDINYVVAGPQVDVGVYDKDEFGGSKTIIEQNDSHYLHQNVKSVIMISTKYAKDVSPEAMFAAAEKFLSGKL